MTFNSGMIDHPTIPVGEIKPRYVRYLNTPDPNGQIITLYSGDGQPPEAEGISDINTSLLLTFNGANGSSTFADTSGKNRTITKSGAPIISTDQSKFGGASAYFNGSSYLTATIPGGLPDSWTIEFWYRKTSDSGWIFNCRPNGSCDGVDIRHDLQITTCSNIIIGGMTIELNRWYHVAFMRFFGSAIYRIVDGVFTGSGSSSNIMTTNSIFYIGGSPNGNTGYLTGYMDDFKISNSTQYRTDLYTITPKNTPIISYHRPSREGQIIFCATSTSGITTAKAYVSVGPQNETYWQSDALIMNMDGLNNSQYLADHSKFNNKITVANNAKIVTTNGISNGSSLYLDGTSHIKIPNSPFKFGTSNFTFELWMNISTPQSASYPYVFASSAYNSGSGFILYLPGPGTGWGGTDRIYFQSSTSGAAGPDMQSTSTFKGQGWKHVAITRNGSTFRLFVNGIQEAIATNSTANFTGNVTSGSLLGAAINGNYADTSSWTKGYFDLFRVTNGACRYTSNFTPPTSFNYLKWKQVTQAPTLFNPVTGQPYDSNWLLYTNLV